MGKKLSDPHIFEARLICVTCRKGLAKGDEPTENDCIPHTIVYHSPDGFEWGYGGSGPSELALNILALFVPLSEAWRLHQRFTSDVIAQIGTDGSTLEPPDVRLWIETFWDREQRER